MQIVVFLSQSLATPGLTCSFQVLPFLGVIGVESLPRLAFFIRWGVELKQGALCQLESPKLEEIGPLRVYVRICSL